MNCLKRKTLVLALCNAVLAESSEAGGNSNAPSPDTINAIPGDVRNAGVPAGKNYSQHGMEWGKRLIEAEQGIVSANATLESTKIDMLREICLLDDLTWRKQYIGGIDATLRTVKDPLPKRYQNLMADLRRVESLCETNGVGVALDKLNAKDPAGRSLGYQKIMESFPVRSRAGGSNKGEGESVVVGEVREAAALGVAPSEISAAIKTLVEQKTGKTMPGNPPVRTSQATEHSADELARWIAVCHQNSIDFIAAALAKRCQMSNIPHHKDLYLSITKVLDAADPQLMAAASVTAAGSTTEPKPETPAIQPDNTVETTEQQS